MCSRLHRELNLRGATYSQSGLYSTEEPWKEGVSLFIKVGSHHHEIDFQSQSLWKGYLDQILTQCLFKVGKESDPSSEQRGEVM